MNRRWIVAMVATGCGRVSFDPASEASAPQPIAWAGPFAAELLAQSATETFAAQARGAEDAIVMQVACNVGPNGTQPTAVDVAAPGWTYTAIDPIVGDVASGLWGASFAAIAPDTAPATITVTWSTTCSDGGVVLADELTGNDPSGGPTTFDGHAQDFGKTMCDETAATGHAGDTVWASCILLGSVDAVPAGYMKGADDGHHDWAAFRFTADAAGTPEDAAFLTSPTSPYVEAMITIKPR